MKKVFMMSLAMLVFTVSAESVDGAWRFSAGPAWRSQVKASISGSVSVAPVIPSHTASYDKDIAGKGSWSVGDVTTVPDPAADNGFAPSGSTLYAAEAILTERTVTANDSTSRASNKDKDSLLGFRAGIGYDFYDNGDFSVGLDLKFAKRALDCKAKSVPSHECRLTAIEIGDMLSIVSLPGEPFNGIAQAIREKSPFKYTFVAELAQDQSGYVPMKECFARGGYEVQPGVDTVAPEAADVIIEAAIKNL